MEALLVAGAALAALGGIGAGVGGFVAYAASRAALRTCMIPGWGTTYVGRPPVSGRALAKILTDFSTKAHQAGSLSGQRVDAAIRELQISFQASPIEIDGKRYGEVVSRPGRMTVVYEGDAKRSIRWLQHGLCHVAIHASWGRLDEEHKTSSVWDDGDGLIDRLETTFTED